ncbi:RNA-binding protein EWS [Salvia splendens]|uniref:RNA-binding protein EWS n=1 Tax=Salvia splendens TaxID=180675 RepID=UPI001C27354A|nr:RNA-binding protein EWS [Salvia splendens]
MGSREKGSAAPHHPLLSSLVVRPAADTAGGAAKAEDGATGAGASDYEPGEVRRDPPPHSRSARHDGHGYRKRAGSDSPIRRRDAHRRSSPGFETFGSSRGRGFRNEREPGQYRDYSPPYARGKDGGRFPGRGYDHLARGSGGPEPLRVEGVPRNNPNVRPREGDWFCQDPLCKNLNFARREHCNNCNRPRYASSGSPRRGGYLGPPFPPRDRVPPALLDHSPVRNMNGGYRSPPRGWPRDDRDFRASGPPGRNEVRLPDPLMRGERPNFLEDDPRDRFGYYDGPPLPEWGHRDHRGRDNFFHERRGGYGGRFLSPPPASAVPPRGWVSHIRDRSRSPARGGPPAKDYHRDMHMNRRRDGRRPLGRGAF